MIYPQYTGDIRPFATALMLATNFGQREVFWAGALSSITDPDPELASEKAIMAVRLFAETRLAPIDAASAIDLVVAILFNPDSTWASLRMLSISNESIGHELTAELKGYIATSLGQYAVTYLNNIASEITDEFGGGGSLLEIPDIVRR